MNNLKEDKQYLKELIRKAYALISPISYHKDLKWLMNRDMSLKFKEQNPKCYLSTPGTDNNMLFPICNRTGMEDPKIIDFSMKLATTLAKTGVKDIGEIIRKLERLAKKFSKDIPKPQDMAIRKGKSTRSMRTASKYLKDIG